MVIGKRYLAGSKMKEKKKKKKVKDRDVGAKSEGEEGEVGRIEGDDEAFCVLNRKSKGEGCGARKPESE